MKRPPSAAISARKTPVQARSQATMRAISQATVQVLLRDGLSRITTTRIAQRAGVSVGTLYQYVPNKQALLLAVLEEHLRSVADSVSAACGAARSKPATVMMERVVAAYLEAKLRDADSSAALYAVSSEKAGTELVRRTSRRLVTLLADLLKTAPDVPASRVEAIAFMVPAAMAGASRAVLEGGATPARVRLLRGELVRLCQAYVAAAAQA